MLPSGQSPAVWGDRRCGEGLDEGADPLPPRSHRYLSHRFAGRVSKFFSKYSPEVAACLLRCPSRLRAAAEGQSRYTSPYPLTPNLRAVGVLSHKTRVEAASSSSSSVCPPVPRLLNRLLGEAMGCFGPFFPGYIPGPFPEKGPFPLLCPGGREKGQGFFSS